MSDAQCFDVVVIGGGPGGQNAAVQASKTGKSVLLIERDQAIGGECVHRGTIPSKTLRHSATVYLGWMRDFAEAAAHERCDRALAGLMKRRVEVTRGHEQFLTRQMGRNGIVVWRGHASFLSPNEIEVRSVDGARRRVIAGSIVIATGSRPRTPPNVPVDHECVLDSDSILSVLYLPESITVLGAGVIACEFASIFAALGVKVVLIDKGERPLAFLDPELTARFVSEFERMGGRFIAKRGFTSVTYDGVSKVTTVLDDGEVIVADKLLCALGRVAQLAGLNVAKAGLVANARGVLEVDEFCRTTVPGIYAVGDVVGPPALAATSMEQGRRAARHALGLPVLQASTTTPIGIYTIPEMSSVGLTEAEVCKLHGAAHVGRANFDELARGVINGDCHGMLKLVCAAHSRELLGAQIVGEGATELIHVAQMAIAARHPVDAFVDNIFNFPTYAEAYLVAALDLIEQRAQVRSEAA